MVYKQSTYKYIVSDRPLKWSITIANRLLNGISLIDLKIKILSYLQIIYFNKIFANFIFRCNCKKWKLSPKY